MNPSLHPDIDLTQIDWLKLPNVRLAAEGEFVLLQVGAGGISLKQFIKEAGSLNYSFNDEDAGNTYYEWTTTLKELKQNVDVVVYDVSKKCIYAGNGVRQALSLPDRGGAYRDAKDRQDVLNFSPIKVRGRDKFQIFISSTSASRKVATGDQILYREVALRF